VYFCQQPLLESLLVPDCHEGRDRGGESAEHNGHQPRLPERGVGDKARLRRFEHRHAKEHDTYDSHERRLHPSEGLA